ncbi:M14 family metallopeptidase [Variovorax sp. J22P271]|uniref:M14 family metallopeptidase n=1 Tax=Variovorax davisae TaxID=3053515 RepID=UPI0025755B27|nr:M14 family metallopeptidase [Variovorax sp. J22P271]MDM0033793.1 M14 family metallopeptidase [Variovorax sp. J22P271]
MAAMVVVGRAGDFYDFRFHIQGEGAMNPSISTGSCFSGTYAEARQKFVEAGMACGARARQFILPDHRGVFGEPLSIDTAYIGPDQPRRLLIVSSGTHGVEGFCGSGCQVAVLHDTGLKDRLAQAGVGLLLIHAINPYGFSHLQRTNEDNIDVNRNFVDFDAPLPPSPHYLEVESFVLPPQWPPSGQDIERQQAFVRQHGERGLRHAVSSGQRVSPQGLFYGGTAPSWSNRTVRAILREHGAAAQAIAWIDIHTGLGPYGHGEKLYAGRNDARDIARARACWGSDVFLTFSGNTDSVSVDVTGLVCSSLHDECVQAEALLVGLEFGTLPFSAVQSALYHAAWIRAHGGKVDAATRAAAARVLRDAFYCDNDVWKGMILGQARVACLQVAQSLARFDTEHAAQP